MWTIVTKFPLLDIYGSPGYTSKINNEYLNCFISSVLYSDGSQQWTHEHLFIGLQLTTSWILTFCVFGIFHKSKFVVRETKPMVLHLKEGSFSLLSTAYFKLKLFVECMLKCIYIRVISFLEIIHWNLFKVNYKTSLLTKKKKKTKKSLKSENCLVENSAGWALGMKKPNNNIIT